MSDCLRAGKPSRYEASQLGRTQCSTGGSEVQIDWSDPKGQQLPGARAALAKWTGWTLAVAVHCYDVSTINIVATLTITITIWKLNIKQTHTSIMLAASNVSMSNSSHTGYDCTTVWASNCTCCTTIHNTNRSVNYWETADSLLLLLLQLLTFV